MRRRRAAFAVGCAIVIWAAAVAVIAALAAEQALSAQRHTTAARRSVLDGARSAAASDLGTARARFRRADALAHSPVLLPVRILPLAGRQLASFDALARAGERVVEAVDRAGRNLPATGTASASPEHRLATAETAARVARTLSDEIGSVNLGPRTWLLPPLASRRAKFAGDVDGIRRAARVLQGLVPMLRGPRSILVLGANNGEMRAGSGMFLTAGELTIQDGHLSLGEMTSTVDLRVPDASVPLDPDMRAQWSWLHPNQEWRNINVTPRFDASGRLAADMWEAIGRGRVDGVIAIDPVALEAILRSTGPVDVDGTRVGADNVVRYLLHDQYEGVPMTDEAKAARRDRLGRLASSAFDAVERGQFDPASLARRLGAAAAGRHILAWSRDPSTEAAWTAGGLDGRLAANDVGVALLNRNGTKLDQFVHIDATLEHARGSAGTLSVRIRNETPSGEPPYIEGPHPLSHSVAGEYEGIALVTLPGAVTGVSVDGQRRVAITGRDGPTQVVGVEVDLRRGASRTLVVRFTLPSKRLEVLPSARVPSVIWHFRHQMFTKGLRRQLSW